MGVFFHLMLSVLLSGLASAKCVARPPPSNLTSTAGPIVDDPVTDSSSTLTTLTTGTTILTTTTPEANETCMIPFLHQSEFTSGAKSDSEFTISANDCNSKCHSSSSCVAYEYRPLTQLCRTFVIRPNLLLKSSCANYPVTVYIKLILPKSAACSPASLYAAFYEYHTYRTLPNNVNYQLKIWDWMTYYIYDY